MDFGGGMATGIAVGIGSGIASGISSWRSQTKKQVRDYVDQNGITIQDRYGKPIKVDDFLNEACGPENENCSANKTWGLVIVGVLVLMASAFVFFLMR